MKTMLAEILKQKRVAAGLSQRDVANKLGYGTPQFISNWERSISRPPIAAIKTVAALYKIEAQGLFEMILQEEVAEVTNALKLKYKSSKAV